VIDEDSDGSGGRILAMRKWLGPVRPWARHRWPSKAAVPAPRPPRAGRSRARLGALRPPTDALRCCDAHPSLHDERPGLRGNRDSHPAIPSKEAGEA